VFALLVAVSLILLTAYFGESAGGPLRSIQRGFLEVISPIQEGASRVLKPVSDLAGWIDDTLSAKGERDKFKKQRDALRTDAAQADLLRRQNRELQAMLNLDKGNDLGSQKPVTARVIGRSPTLWYATITIDQGSDAGIRDDQPVVNGEGLVGKISATSGNAAQVTLITDSTSGVSAEIAATGVTGLVKTEVGQPTDLLLDFVSRTSKVSKGQRVVTAGTRSSRLESLFPAGIPIGSVSRIEPSELDIYKRVHVTPFADVRRLDFVQVLTRPDTAPKPPQLTAQVPTTP
jgi:rod shape-determining protein MreC